MMFIVDDCRFTQIDRLVEIFLENASLQYISNGDIKCNRAEDMQTWRHHLATHLRLEFVQAFSPDGLTYTRRRIFVGWLDNQIIGFAVIVYHLDNMYPYVELDDIIITKAHRCKGYGKAMIEHIATEARRAGAKALFLESGIANTRAHELFESIGFNKGSVIMMKDIEGGKSE